MRYKNKLGIFTFPEGIPVSLVKLVANTVSGQYFFSKPGETVLHSEEDCYTFMRNHPSNVLVQEVPFTLEIL